MAKLVIASGDQKTEHEIGSVLTIGRKSTNDIVLQGEKVSREHARVIPAGDRYVVEDLGSSNGSFINGVKVTRGTLSHGDTLSIGEVNMIFHDDLSDQLEGDLVGNYRIRKRIGQGGMGAVYRAIQITMDREVALKLLKPELTRNPTFLKSFITEARMAGRLNHPNIVQVHDVGEADGIFYISMEFVEGETLHDVLAREGKVPVARSLDVIVQVAKALEHAQKQQIIHQDIKPQNLMIDPGGNVKLADLGLAKVVGHRDVRERRGTIMGTPHYMAPEQGKGQTVDGRADIYSLGATWYHMITGRVPFDGPNSLTVITKHINQQLPSPKQYDNSIPDEVCELIERMMAKDPAARPQDATALLAELQAVRSQISGDLAEAAERKETAKRVKRKARASAASRGLSAAAALPEARAPSGGVLLPGALAAVGMAIIIVVYLLFFARPQGGGGGDDPAKAAAGRPAQILASADKARAEARTGDELKFLRQLAEGFPDAPEGRAAQARILGVQSELLRAEGERASRDFRAILALPRGTPDEKQNVVKMLRSFLSAYSALPDWSEKAQDELAALVEEASPSAASPAGGGTTGHVGDELINAKARASKLEQLGQFAAARKVLKDYIESHSGADAQSVGRTLSELEGRAETHYRSIFDRAGELSRQGRYVQATALYTKLIAEDPSGRFADLARKELRKNDEATERLFKATTARADALFKSFQFDAAAAELRRSEAALAGTSWGNQVADAVERTALGAQALGDLTRKVAASPTKPYKAKDLSGQMRTGSITSVGPEGIKVKVGGAETLRKWADLTDKDVYEIHLLYEPKGVEHVDLGAYWMCRGVKDYARTELEKAVREGAQAELAGKLLAGLEAAAASGPQTAYDFGRWEQAEDWEPAGGSWSLLSGELVQDGRDQAEVALKRTLSARDLSISLDFTVKSDGGLFSVELVRDKDNYFGFALDSKGFEANASVSGKGSSARGDWRYTAGRKHRLEMKLSRDILTVTLDGKAMPELSAQGLEALEGRLVVRTLDTGCSLDNVALSAAGDKAPK